MAEIDKQIARQELAEKLFVGMVVKNHTSGGHYSDGYIENIKEDVGKIVDVFYRVTDVDKAREKFKAAEDKIKRGHFHNSVGGKMEYLEALLEETKKQFGL